MIFKIKDKFKKEPLNINDFSYQILQLQGNENPLISEVYKFETELFFETEQELIDIKKFIYSMMNAACVSLNTHNYPFNDLSKISNYKIINPSFGTIIINKFNILEKTDHIYLLSKLSKLNKYEILRSCLWFAPTDKINCIKFEEYFTTKAIKSLIKDGFIRKI